MAMATEEKAGIEERYLAATNATNMRIDTRPDSPRTQADVVLAAGLARGNQLGHALVFLRGQWDRADKPRKATAADIAKRAAQIPDKKGRPDIRRATVEAMVQHASAMRARAAKLTGRSVVLGLLMDWARANEVDADLLSPAIFHWLSPTCPACEGRGLVKIPDAPSLSNKSCLHCRGVGEWPRPHGAEAIHSHMKRCFNDAKAGTGRALYG